MRAGGPGERGGEDRVGGKAARNCRPVSRLPPYPVRSSAYVFESKLGPVGIVLRLTPHARESKISPRERYPRGDWIAHSASAHSAREGPTALGMKPRFSTPQQPHPRRALRVLV